MANSIWNDKKVLVIGDSITSDGRWQKKFSEITGADVTTHAYGGIGLIDMVFGLGTSESREQKYDPYTGANGNFRPLSKEDVNDKDLIIFYGGYNERDIEYGSMNDMFPDNITFIGKYRCVLNRIYQLLSETDNLACRVALVAPHCVGKYSWVDRDGYEDFPEGSGRSLETMSSVVKGIASSFNIPCYDAWHNSGIGKYTWCVFANSPVVIDPMYDPDHTDGAPYPQYADQAHLNEIGYARLGECIAHFAETI